jgi:lipoate---protein ligase
MKLFDCSFPSPAANLAADEVLLDLCEEHGTEVLRFWESPVPFVVVGYGNRIATEVNVAACESRGVSILRRCSGGGTVVQGPGCLNYAVTLRVDTSAELSTVTATNRFVMERHRAALEKLLGTCVFVEGYSDLAVEAGRVTPRAPGAALMKFSGNAQRRRRDSILFHGTILYAFDLSLASELLNAPSKQPDYREAREHGAFITNAKTNATELKRALVLAWDANEPLATLSSAAVDRLCRDRYARRDWNADRT